MDLQELVVGLYKLVDALPLSTKDQVSFDVFKEDDETTITIHIASIGGGGRASSPPNDGSVKIPLPEVLTDGEAGNGTSPMSPRPSSTVTTTANIKGEDLVMVWRNRGKN